MPQLAGALQTALRVNDSDVDNYTYTYNDANDTYYGDTIPEDEAMAILYHYVDPVLIVIGLFGNVMTCYAMRKTPIANFSVSVYFFACAMSNIMMLLLNASVSWFTEIFGYKHIDNLNDYGCRLWQFIFRLVTYSAIWFVVGVVIDRYIVLWHPHKAQDMCTVFTARIAVAFTLVGMTVVSIHALWMYEVSADGWCHTPAREPQIGWLWVSGMAYGLVPIIVIFIIGNTLILRYCLKHCGRCIPDTENANTELTHVVVVLSMVYFVFNFPATVINIIDQVKPLSWRSDISIATALHNARNATNVLASLNHLCLFGTLLIFSKVFRKTLKEAFWKCITCIRRRSATVELSMMADNYEQVPSNSTTI